MGCTNSVGAHKDKIYEEKSVYEDNFQFKVVPPSEKWSQASRVSSIVIKNPAELFNYIDVDKCFKHGQDPTIPSVCNQT